MAANDFLDSIGTQSAISTRGESLDKTIACARYLGARWFRAGIEGNVPIEQFVQLHNRVGLRFSWGLGSGGTNIAKLIATGRQMAAAGALLAFEGPNEPNNWGIIFDGQRGGRGATWVAVAKLQNALYTAVKSDPALAAYPVWSISEGGAETDNAGLQYLTIPEGAHAELPAGTHFADYANVHNYIYHPNAAGPEANKTWKAADPGPACRVDGLYGEYGLTWARHFPGYSPAELEKLPKVTTETGETIGGPVTEESHGLNLLTMYLDQFARGWSYTCVYLMRDRVDEGGNQQFGFFKPDYTPRKAAVYLHNMTTILADRPHTRPPGTLAFAIQNEPATTHHLLMQKSNGAFELVIWSERLSGVDNVQVTLEKSSSLIKVFDPTVGTSPLEMRGTIDSLTLPMSDHPVVVEIKN